MEIRFWSSGLIRIERSAIRDQHSARKYRRRFPPINADQNTQWQNNAK
jgi:hypothetical protein